MATRARRSGSTRNSRLIVAGLLLALVAGIGLVAARLITQDSPERAVEVYLKALEAGNAKLALERSANVGDASLLTNEVLAVAERPTNIKVTGKGDAVRATYALGGQQVERAFPTVHADKRWRVTQPTSSVTVDEPSGVHLAGKPLPARLTLFPGIYRLGTSSPLLGLTQRTLDVPQPGTDVAVKPGLGISQAGVDRFREAVRTSLTECAATKQLAPSGCPWNLANPAGASLAPESIKVDLPADAIPVTWNPASSSLQSAPLTLPVTITGTVTRKDTTTYAYTMPTKVTAVASAPLGEQLKVTWRVTG